MAIIGTNTDTGLGVQSENNTAPQYLFCNASYIYQAGADEEVFKFGVRIGTGIGDGSGVTMALYDLGTSPPANGDGATKIAEGTISTLSAGAWNTVTITPVLLTSGRYYAVALKINSATNVSTYRAFLTNAVNRHSTLTGASAYPSSWTAGTALSQRYGLYAETQASAGGSGTLTDVDTDESVKAGATSVPYTGTGLSAADGMLFTTGSQSAAATSFVATNATSGTFTAPSTSAIFTAGVKFGTGTWDIQDGGSSLATLAGTIEVPTGYQLHTVSDISQAADPDCIYNGKTPAVAVGDVVYYPTTSTLGYTVSIDSQGFPTFASGGDKRTDSFLYRIFDDSAKDWSSADLEYEVYATPILSSPSGIAISGSSANCTVSTDEAEGTIWVVVTNSATTPTHAQIKTGQDHTGGPADASSSSSVSSSPVTINLTSILSGTRYAHFTQENAATVPVAAIPVTSPSFSVTSPALLLVGDDDIVWAGELNVPLVGTGLSSVNGFRVISGTQSVLGSVDFATGTSVQVDIPTDDAIFSAGVKFGTVTADVMASGVSLATRSATLDPEAGYFIHSVSDISQAADPACLYYGRVPAVAVGDQFYVAEATTTYGWAAAFDYQGFPDWLDGGNKATDTLIFRHFDDSSKSWGAAQIFERVTAPVNSIAVSATPGGATVVVSSNVEEGTLYVVASESSIKPSAAQLSAGQDHTGAAAIWSANDTSVRITNPFVVTGLPANTTHYIHAVQINAASTPIYGSVVTSVGFGQSVDLNTATTNDIILAVTGGPTLSDGLKSWYLANGATGPSSLSMVDLEKQFLVANIATFSNSLMDLWMAYLTGLGYSGTFQDMYRRYWESQLGG